MHRTRHGTHKSTHDTGSKEQRAKFIEEHNQYLYVGGRSRADAEGVGTRRDREGCEVRGREAAQSLMAPSSCRAARDLIRLC